MISALCLVTGLLYMRVISNEIYIMTPPKVASDPVFTYRYGWAFFLTCSAFIGSTICAALSMSVYIRRCDEDKASSPQPEDIEQV